MWRKNNVLEHESPAARSKNDGQEIPELGPVFLSQPGIAVASHSTADGFIRKSGIGTAFIGPLTVK
jgi:hypothetical protein